MFAKLLIFDLINFIGSSNRFEFCTIGFIQDFILMDFVKIDRCILLLCFTNEGGSIRNSMTV